MIIEANTLRQLHEQLNELAAKSDPTLFVPWDIQFRFKDDEVMEVQTLTINTTRDEAVEIGIV